MNGQIGVLFQTFTHLSTMYTYIYIYIYIYIEREREREREREIKNSIALH